MSGSSKKRRSDTRDPRRSRARALKLLYQADVRGEDPVALLDKVAADARAASLLDDLDPDEAADIEVAGAADDAGADPEHARLAAARARNVAPIDGFTRSLVTGVAQRRDELDALVQRFARRWALARMPAVDRNALRLGAYELQHESTSPAVVINEMVELAKGLSTDDSGRYVNGVLEAIRKELAAAPPVAAPPVAAEDAVSLEPDAEPRSADDPRPDAATPEPDPATPEPDPATPEPDPTTQPAPVSLPDDAELVEVSTPTEEPADGRDDHPDAAEAYVAPAGLDDDPEAEDQDVADMDADALDAGDPGSDDPGSDEPGVVDAPDPADDPAGTVDGDDGPTDADEGREPDPADELRQEHGYVAGREDADDPAQQQLF